MNIQEIVNQFDDLPTFLSKQEEYTLPELYTAVTTAFGFPLKQGKSYNKTERQQVIDFVREHLNWDDDLNLINGYLEDWRLTGYVALPVFYWTRPAIVGFITLCLEYHMILEANKLVEETQSEEEEHWDGYVDIKIAQALADKSHRTIRSWIEKGFIEAKKENPKNRQSKWMIDRKSLFDYLGDEVMLNPLDLYPVEESTEEQPFFDHVDLEYNADCDYNVVDVGLTSRPEYAIEKSLNVLIETFLSHFPVEHHKFITKFEKQSSTFVVAFKLAK